MRGSDGSELVLRSIIEAKAHLKPGGRLLLLPHWTNLPKARQTLAEHYSEVHELERINVEFFPARDDVIDDGLLAHLRQLADNGSIEMTFDADVPMSSVSVVEALRAAA